MMRAIQFLSAWAALTTILVTASFANAEPRPGSGPIEYQNFPGKATIVRVEKTEASNANKGNAAEGYEVVFTFKPDNEVTAPLGKAYLERHVEHKFTLINGWHVGPLFLKKYGIEKGKEFKATLMVIVKGTSTPVMLKLDAVPNDDYFEATAK